MRKAPRVLLTIPIAALSLAACDYFKPQQAAPPAAPVATAPPPAAPAAPAPAPAAVPAAPAPSVNAQMHVNQGITFATMKDWDNAIVEFTKAASIDPRYAAAYTNRAVAYMQQGKFNKAMDDLKQAEGIDPRDKMIFYNYVALYSRQNQLDRALDSLDRALDLGFANYDALRGDPDLTNLRRHPEYAKVLEKHKVFIR